MIPKNNKTRKKSPRSIAREYAVQSLYQWQLSSANIKELTEHFAHEKNYQKMDKDYGHELICNCISHHRELDSQMSRYLSRSIGDVNPVELAILRVAFYEFCHRLDVPYRVVINEAIDLAKLYGASDSHRFINGVLDAAAKDLRALEVGLRKK